MRYAVLVGLLLLVACQTTQPIYLQNPVTGQRVQCGPYDGSGIQASASVVRESQCVQDFKEQGYVRLAG